MSSLATFGKIISAARKEKEMNQKQLAEAIKREDGETISPQYLNDIEHDRRVPSTEIIKQIAEVLDLDADYLHVVARKWPDDLPVGTATPKQVQQAMVAFRKKITQ